MSSSIFNFDALRRAFGLPPRVHLWHLFLVASGIAVLSASSAVMHRVKPEAATTFRAKGELRDAEVLILGDSQLRMIVPDSFPAPTQNRALSGSDYEIQHALLEEFARRAPKLKLVVLEMDVLPSFIPGMGRRGGDYRDVVDIGLPVWKLPVLSWPERMLYLVRYNWLLRPFLVGPKYELPDPYPIDAPARRAPAPPKTGPQPVPGFTLLATQGEEKMSHYIDSMQKENNAAANQAAFMDMLKFCWARNIKVALLMPPQTKEFVAKRPPDWTQWLQDMRAAAERLAPPGMLEVWDEQSEMNYTIEEFADPNHIGDGSGHLSQAVRDRVDAFLKK